MNNYLKMLMAIVGSFVVLWLSDIVFNSYLLADLYLKDPSLWLIQTDKVSNVILVTQVLFSIAFVLFFTDVYKGEGMPEGLRFGAYLGSILAISKFSLYAYMPIPLEITMYQSIAMFLSSVACGITTGLIYAE
jgi:hypothetical protein